MRQSGLNLLAVVSPLSRKEPLAAEVIEWSVALVLAAGHLVGLTSGAEEAKERAWQDETTAGLSHRHHLRTGDDADLAVGDA